MGRLSRMMPEATNDARPVEAKLDELIQTEIDNIPRTAAKMIEKRASTTIGKNGRGSGRKSWKGLSRRRRTPTARRISTPPRRPVARSGRAGSSWRAQGTITIPKLMTSRPARPAGVDADAMPARWMPGPHTDFRSAHCRRTDPIAPWFRKVPGEVMYPGRYRGGPRGTGAPGVGAQARLLSPVQGRERRMGITAKAAR